MVPLVSPRSLRKCGRESIETVVQITFVRLPGTWAVAKQRPEQSHEGSRLRRAERRVRSRWRRLSSPQSLGIISHYRLAAAACSQLPLVSQEPGEPLELLAQDGGSVFPVALPLELFVGRLADLVAVTYVLEAGAPSGGEVYDDIY
jgi:hypothetical protein